MDRPSLYQWDEAKRRANLAKHKVDFAAAEGFDWQTAFIAEDRRREYGEARCVALGLIERATHVIVFTVRRHRVRIISLRKANRKESARYANSL